MRGKEVHWPDVSAEAPVKDNSLCVNGKMSRFVILRSSNQPQSKLNMQFHQHYLSKWVKCQVAKCKI